MIHTTPKRTHADPSFLQECADITTDQEPLQQEEDEDEIFLLGETIQEADIMVKNAEALGGLDRQTDRQLVHPLLEYE